MAPEARTARLIETVNIKMAAAHDRCDYQEVISLGRLVEEDFALIHDVGDWDVESSFLDAMVRAFSGLWNYVEAVAYSERLSLCCAAAGQSKAQGQALMNLGAMKLIGMGARVEAAACYEKVRDIGVRGGYFAMESKACEGLSRLANGQANGEVRKAEALEFAKQALIAAELMQDDEFGKQLTEADAVLAVINSSDLAAPDCDEAPIHRFADLARDLRDQAGSMHLVIVQEVWVRRHKSMGRKRECADACREILALAAAPRMAQNRGVQQVATNARVTLHKIGLSDR
jgi:hypothetical protein